jgi:hypothetical protein
MPINIPQMMDDTAPTFGNVLKAIGLGVATSQEALDKGIIETVNTLNGTKITVVTDVVLKLDDDGMPIVSDDDLVSQEVSVLNYVTPTIHEWKHVALSMDLSMSSVSEERGIEFTREQRVITNHNYGLFWGFFGWTDTDDQTTTSTYNQQTKREVDWESGQVRLDAMLGPRTTTKFPVPAQVSTGPQIFLNTGALVETKDTHGVVTDRSLDILLKIIKADGSVNPNVGPLAVNAGVLLVSAADTDGYTAGQTNAEGKAKFTLSRKIFGGFGQPYRTKVTVTWNDIVRTLEVVL